MHIPHRIIISKHLTDNVIVFPSYPTKTPGQYEIPKRIPIIFHSRVPETEREREERLQKSIPSYFSLCKKVYTKLCNENGVVEPVSFLLSFFCIGHLFTDIGRYCWLLVLQKFVVFFLASLGIITADVFVEVCGVKDELQAETEDEYGDNNMFQYSCHRNDNEEEGKQKEWNDIQNYTYVSKFAVCMTSIIGCRAVLWQIVPYLSILSVSG